MRDADAQLEYLEKDLEGLRYSNDVMLDRNYDIK